VIKAEEWPTLMGMKRLPLNWCFTLRIGGGEGKWSWDAVRCSGQWLHGGRGRGGAGGDTRPAAAVPALFSTGRKKKAGWAGRAKRPSRPVGRLGRLGQKLKEIPF
jgi:hypothetical protein